MCEEYLKTTGVQQFKLSLWYQELIVQIDFNNAMAREVIQVSAEFHGCPEGSSFEEYLEYWLRLAAYYAYILTIKYDGFTLDDWDEIEAFPYLDGSQGITIEKVSFYRPDPDCFDLDQVE